MPVLPVCGVLETQDTFHAYLYQEIGSGCLELIRESLTMNGDRAAVPVEG
jgi:hypothetical protein